MPTRTVRFTLMAVAFGFAACEHNTLEPRSDARAASAPLVLDTIRVPAPTDPPLSPVPAEVFTRGTVTEVPSRLGEAAFLIEEHPDRPLGPGAGPYTTGDKYHVYVDGRTSIGRRVGPGEIRSATLEEITVGSRAEVWFVGPIRESYPAQGTAGRIMIADWVPEED